MKALIIEDEIMAAKTLQKLLGEVSPETEVVAVLESIEDSVAWIEENPMPDLMFMDIHLADGSSFAIFDRVDITCPIIFTTAYDEYALKAFEVNSIDYLLKPISKEALGHAMRKYRMLDQGRQEGGRDNIEAMLAQLTKKNSYRRCFLLPERDKLVPLPTANIAYAYIEAKTVKLVSMEHKEYALTANSSSHAAPSRTFRCGSATNSPSISSWTHLRRLSSVRRAWPNSSTGSRIKPNFFFL